MTVLSPRSGSIHHGELHALSPAIAPRAEAAEPANAAPAPGSPGSAPGPSHGEHRRGRRSGGRHAAHPPGRVRRLQEPAQIPSENKPWGLSPQQIRTAYSLLDIASGAIPADGTGQTIAIVNAYDDPDLLDSADADFSSSDLAQFDQQYGLPSPPSFVKINEQGSTAGLPGTDPSGPGTPGNWEEEEALDVEWAHAMAPGASIILVECNSSSSADLYQGAMTAASLPGVSVVSMSWGCAEYNGETIVRRRLHHAERSSGCDLRGRRGRHRIARHVSGLFAERGRRRRDEPDDPRRRCLRQRDGLVQRRRRHQHHRAGARLSERRRRAPACGPSPTSPSTPTRIPESPSTTPTTTPPARAPGRRSAARAWGRPAGPP